MFISFPQECRFLTEWLNACTFYVGCDHIEFVEYFSHLAHTIKAEIDDASDIMKYRNDLLGQVNNILCYFIVLIYMIVISGSLPTTAFVT